VTRLTAVLVTLVAVAFVTLAAHDATSQARCRGRSHHCRPSDPRSNRTVYIAQTSRGSANGSDCANARSVRWFNNPADWAPRAGRIRPGVTVHLCGGIASPLTVHGRGMPGKPIRILFGRVARLAEPVCNPCLDMTNAAYISVDGALRGVIENTGDGTGVRDHAGARRS